MPIRAQGFQRLEQKRRIMSRALACFHTLTGAAIMLCCGPTPAGPSTDKCSDLSKLTLTHAENTLAETAAAGAFVSPSREALDSESRVFSRMPAFCRVAAALHPTTDSDIRVEVWMPVFGWNGTFQGQGNGGFAGSIDYVAMAIAISAGYATAGTDTGHSGGDTDATWALGHPEKVVDYGYP
jgi:hypothetical protein